MTRNDVRSWLHAGVAAAGLIAALPAWAAAAPAATDAAAPAPAPAADAADAGTTNTDDIIVSATRVNAQTPITASVHTTEPQAIVSRSIIENSVSPTADYSQVILLTPGASLAPSSGNGVGLGDAKVTLRGFKDGQYNITYDGIPFEDSNDPTHHSTSYFPDGTYERIIVDRGPGTATDLGQASYGGNVHLVSREASDRFFIEAQSVYGSFNTLLERLTVNSGAIAKLGDLKVIAVGEYKQTDGALHNQPGWWGNGFVKVEKPLGPDAKFSILANYNQSLFNQSDAAGGATLFQTATYGLRYGATRESNPGLFPNARMDWNWQNKTTDFEMARLQWDLSSKLHLDQKVYTFFYKNFTLSTEDSTTPCTGAGSSFDTCQATGYKNAKNAGHALTAYDIPGYTKLNQYRDWGDVLQLTYDTPIGPLHAGAWYEHSASKRFRYDYDFTTGAAAGGIGQYKFDFGIMNNGSNWNFKETDAANNVMLNGQPVPLYIKYDERTSWDLIQGFASWDMKFFDDKLTLTPGVKVQDFTRKINTPIAAQTSRAGIYAQESYKPTLPYATINYLFTPGFSVYGQFAKGFIIPSLSASLETRSSGSAINQTVPLVPSPTRTTNWQAGTVFAGERLNIDADVYYIESSNSTYTDPTNNNNVTVNGDPAHYKGVEAQVSYVVIPGLTAIANGTIMSSKDAVNHKWLPGAPNYTALLGAVYNTGRYKFSYLQKWTGKQWTDANNTPAGLLGAYSYGIASGSVTFGGLTLGLTVNNVLNDRSPMAGGVPSASTLYIYDAPRSYLASLKFRY